MFIALKEGLIMGQRYQMTMEASILVLDDSYEVLFQERNRFFNW